MEIIVILMGALAFMLLWFIGDTVLHIEQKIDRYNNYKNVEVVTRCKDCEWYNHPGCAIKITSDDDKPCPNDFCSFAEKKGRCE